MADEYASFFPALKAVLEDVAGINQAPENPPENVNDPPMIVTYLVGGDIEYSAGRGYLSYNRVHADLLLARSVLPNDYACARPFILKVGTAIAANISMSDTCEHCHLVRFEGPGNVSGYASPTFGVRFVLDVKIKHTSITDISA